MSKVDVQHQEIRMARYRIEIETNADLGWDEDELGAMILGLVERGPEANRAITHVWVDPPQRMNEPTPPDAPLVRAEVESGLPALGNLLDKAVSFGEEMGKVAAKAKPVRAGKPTPNGQRQKYSDEFCLKVFKAYKASGWAKTEREFALPAATLSYLIKRAEKALAAQAAAPLSEQLPDDASEPAAKDAQKTWAERVLDECRKECYLSIDVEHLACACAVVASRTNDLADLSCKNYTNEEIHAIGTRRLRNPMTRDICQRILARVGE